MREENALWPGKEWSGWGRLPDRPKQNSAL